MSKSYKDKEKDIKYSVWTVRLSDENINWLKNKRKDFDSWNKLFDYLIKIWSKL